jgi:hypothetical protein
LGLIVIGGFKIYEWHQASQKFATKIDCMKETGSQCAYLRCDAGCMFPSEGWEPVSGRSFDPSSQLLFQKISKWGPCPEPGSCKATTTVYFDGRITRNGSRVGSLSNPAVEAVAEQIKGVRSEKDCSYQEVMDISSQYRLPHASIPSDGYISAKRCDEFTRIEEKINEQIGEKTIQPKKETKNIEVSEKELSQRVDTHFIIYPDVYISEKENGKRAYELSSGVANEIPESEDKRQRFREKLSDISDQFGTSYYKLVKVYDDGRKESVPLKMRYCPPDTDVCGGTTNKIDMVTGESARADERPIEMTSAIKGLKLTAGGEIVDSMERPDSRPQITSFKANNPEISKARSQRGASIIAPENRDSNDTFGATSSRSDEQKSDSNENKKIHVSVKPSETNNINGSLEYLRRPDEWRLATIFARDNATSTIDFDYKVSPDRISSEFKNIDFKAEVTDGFYFVEAQKDDLVTMERQPPKFDLSVVREIHYSQQFFGDKRKVYLRAPFAIKVHNFSDPLLGRSDSVPDKYQVSWESETLPLEDIATATQSKYYTGLQIDIPDGRDYTSYTGKHTITLRLEEKGGNITTEKSVTFDLTSLAESCSSKEAIKPRSGCPPHSADGTG